MDQGSSSILMLVLMVGIFYFLLIRPENKRKKAAQELRNSLKKGERVTTIGGIMGKVISVSDDSLVIETSEDRVRLEMTKWAIQTSESMEAAKAAAKAKGGKGSKKISAKTEAPADEPVNDDQADAPEVAANEENK